MRSLLTRRFSHRNLRFSDRYKVCNAIGEGIKIMLPQIFYRTIVNVYNFLLTWSIENIYFMIANFRIQLTSKSSRIELAHYFGVQVAEDCEKTKYPADYLS